MKVLRVGVVLMGVAAISLAARAEDLRACPERTLLPPMAGVPYNPWEYLKKAAAGDKLPPNEFYFVVLADSKTSATKARMELYKRQLRYILYRLAPRPVMLFEVGDLVGGNGSRNEYWRSFHDCVSEGGFWEQVAYIPTIGDHDCGGSEYEPPTSYGGSEDLAGARYHEFFHIPREMRSPVAGGKYAHLNERYWAFEYKNCLFLSMDGVGRQGMRGGEIYGNKYGQGGRQKAWLEEVMAATKAQHIFFFCEHGAPWNYGRDALGLLEKYKATAFFSGHAHNYGRYCRKGNHCTYYVNGTAASGTDRINDLWADEAQVLTSVIGFTLVHVKGGRATASFHCMDHPNGILHKYTPEKSFKNMPAQCKKFFAGGTELIGWVMDTNVMTSQRPSSMSRESGPRPWPGRRQRPR